MGVAGFAEYLEDALSDYAEAEKADLILFMGWMDERVEDSVQLFVLDQKPVVPNGESI